MQGLVAAAELVSGGFDQLLTFAMFGIVAFSTLTVASVFVLRARKPDAPRPFRVPGYPFVPALFVGINVWVLWSVVQYAWSVAQRREHGGIEALVALAIVLAGVPAYAAVSCEKPCPGESMIRRCSLALLVLATACARAPAPRAPWLRRPRARLLRLPRQRSLAPPTDAFAPVPDAAPASTVAAAAPEAPLEGLDFIEQAQVLFRVAACGPTGEVPSRFDAAVVEKHCAELGRAYDEYKKGWVDVAKPFIATLRPEGPARAPWSIPSAEAIS